MAGAPVGREGSDLPGHEPTAASSYAPTVTHGYRSGQYVRYGPGVPGATAASEETAEGVWRGGPAGRRPRRAWQLAGLALTVVLLAASGVVIYLRLHHPPFGVTGVAVTRATSGCTPDVTGRIDTTGGAGVVSYEWVFTPRLAAPDPLRQSVAAGQSSVYVTAGIQGRGHGTLRQTVTLQVLGTGRQSASVHVTVRC